jgi:ABC-type polysaccharide/polyol phosphate transport system ATPase subunit
MKRKTAIEFKKVTKSYMVDREKRLRQSLTEKKRKGRRFKAVDEVSWEVKDKQVIGLYGVNGSGKTTILRLIAGITQPDRGKIKVKGRVAAVLELGSGWHYELTGRENVYLYGSILGIEKKEMEKKVEKIMEFAELKEFLDVPVKKYSAGMKVRLAFAVAIFAKPEILLVDEVLAVGDQDFKLKCLQYLEKLKGKATMVLVSHNLPLLLSLCDEVVLVDKGRIENRLGAGRRKKMKELIQAYLKVNQELSIQALSKSMEPVIKKGERLRIKKGEFKKLKAGEIVALAFDNFSQLIVHRIVARVKDKELGYLTKGDASLMIDPWILREGDFIGIVKKG